MLPFADRLLTIVVTATLTSAAWIVAGGTVLERQAAMPSAAPVSPGPGRSVAEWPAASSAVGALAIPVAGVSADQLVDSFGDERGGERSHRAIDIMAPAGTPVVAAAPGIVESLFQSQAGGNTVYVRSADRRTIYYYAHLRDYAPGLAEGQRVAAGQRLGSVGSSGNAEEGAPHLHFAVLRTTPDADWWDSAGAVNPYPLLGGR